MDPSNKVTGRCIWNTYWYFNNETGNFKKWHDIKNNSCLVSWYIRFNESGDWEILPSSEIDANTSHNYAKPSHVLLRSHQKIIHHHLTIDIICIYILYVYNFHIILTLHLFIIAFPTTLGSKVTTAPVQEAKVAQRNRACAAPERVGYGLKDLGKGWVDGWVEKSNHVGIYI